MKRNNLFLLMAFAVSLLAGCVKDEKVEVTPTPVVTDAVLINEVYSRGVPDAPDWVEIYNNSDSQVDISGYKIYDSGGESGAKPKKEFPTGSVIAARGFLVIVVDDGTESGFGVSSTGEELWLANVNAEVVDNITVSAMEDTQSFGCYPDGSDNLQLLNTITRGTSNSPGVAPEKIKINELYSKGDSTNPDWVELYNAGTTDVDLGAYKIYDSGGQAGTKPKLQFPTGTILTPGSFLVIVVDGEGESNFGLSGNGETIWLEKGDGTLADSVIFPALEDGQSYGRYPDGANNWQILYVPTPGAANDNTAPPTEIIIKMNEIFSKGTDADPDWIEIYNGSTVDVNLSGYKIYDSGGLSGSKPKKEFPAGTVIPAGGFFVIVTDDTVASGFGLSSNGEEVWLEDANSTVIDDVTFTAMVDGQSYGRKPDGSDTFFTFTEITRGTSNNNAATLPKLK